MYEVHYRQEDWERFQRESRQRLEDSIQRQSIENGFKCVSCSQIIPVRPRRDKHQVYYNHLVNDCKKYREQLRK